MARRYVTFWRWGKGPADLIIARGASICDVSDQGAGSRMSLSEWFWNQELVYWVQGIGSLAAAGAAVGIALRQERFEIRRAEAARSLRRQVLAAAIAPVLRD